MPGLSLDHSWGCLNLSQEIGQNIDLARFVRPTDALLAALYNRSALLVFALTHQLSIKLRMSVFIPRIVNARIISPAAVAAMPELEPG